MRNCKKNNATKIIAKTWLFLQNKNIAEKLGYKLIKGTETKLVNKLKEIAIIKKTNPHIKDVNFKKKELIVRFGKEEVKIDLKKYPLPYYYIPVK